MALLNGKIKKKQQYLIIGIMSAVIGGAMLIVYANKSVKENAEKEADPEIIIERYSGLSESVDEDNIWRATSSNVMDEIKRENEKLKKDLTLMKASILSEVNSAMREKTAEIQASLRSEQRDQLTRVGKEAKIIAENEAQKTSSQIHVTKRAFERTNPQITNDPALASFDINHLEAPKPIKEVDIPRLQSLTFGVPLVNTEDELKKIEAEVKEKVTKETSSNVNIKNRIPSGTFVRALLLGGVDAPTGGQAQGDPYPILFEVLDSANLPNGFKFDLKKCRVVASGYGEISSERANIRLEKISCIAGNGDIYETQVKGNVFDETGKAGMRGRLVSKQGQMIANGLLAGIASGMGGAFQRSSTQYTANALGNQTESFISTNDALVAGLGEGVGTTFDRLSRYFIDLAEKMFPVIEIDAGRIVDIVFTSGFTLKPSLASDRTTSEGQGVELSQGGELTIGDLVQGSTDALNQAQTIIQQPRQGMY